MRHAWRETDVSKDPRSVRISDPIKFDDQWIIFAASDDAGAMLIRVGRLAWERLQSDAPDWFDSDDRRDYALGMIEAEAAGQASVMKPDRVLTLLPRDP